MKQLKASMPDEMIERLEKASAKAGRSLSAEIYARVEASFAQEAMDKATLDFLNGVALMPAEIEREFGAAWHKHAAAHGMFTKLILAWLKLLKPEGSTTVFPDRPHATLSLPTALGGDLDQLASIMVNRLRQQPDFTTSPMRRLLEDEYRMNQSAMTGARSQKAPAAPLDQPKRGKR